MTTDRVRSSGASATRALHNDDVRPRWTVADVLGVLLVANAAALLARSVFFDSATRLWGTALWSWIATVSFYVIAVVAVCVVLVRHSQIGAIASWLRLPRSPVNWLLLALVAAELSYLTSTWTGVAIEPLMPTLPVQCAHFSQLQKFSAIGSLLYLCVAVPLGEEILWRGFVFKWMLARMKPWAALIGIGVISGLDHGLYYGLGLAISVMVPGIIFAWLYYSSRSLLPGVAAHALLNGYVVLTTHASC